MVLMPDARRTMTMLPTDFKPSADDVILGRGRVINMHAGNQAFLKLVFSCLHDYSNSTSKLEKSFILRSIVMQVRKNSPCGGFVKRDSSSGRWYEVGDFLARERTSQAFRDILYGQYKSSNASKKLRRLHDHDIQPLSPKSSAVVGAGGGETSNEGKGLLVHNNTDLRHNPQSYSAPTMCNNVWDNSLVATTKAGYFLTESISQHLGGRATLHFPFQIEKAGADINATHLIDISAGLLNDFEEFAPATHLLPQVSLTSSCCSSLPSEDPASAPALASFPLVDVTMQSHQLQTLSARQVFDRLVSIAGNFSVEGDPFSPAPIAT